MVQQKVKRTETASSRYIFVFLAFRLIHASVFGPKLLIDCSFDDRMNELEKKSAGRQIALAVSDNRKQRAPFDLQLFNVDFKGKSFEMVEKYMPNIRTKVPMMISENSYTTAYPREKLLYLSPDSENELINFDPGDIYVLGAIVDKGASRPLSLTKARMLGIRHARLPLDRYVKFKRGSRKRLGISNVVEILQSWKTTKDWEEAFRRIPSYKLNGEEN